MAVTHSTTFRNTVCDALTTALGASPKMKLLLSGTVSAPGTDAAMIWAVMAWAKDHIKL